RYLVVYHIARGVDLALRDMAVDPGDRLRQSPSRVVVDRRGGRDAVRPELVARRRRRVVDAVVRTITVVLDRRALVHQLAVKIAVGIDIGLRHRVAAGVDPGLVRSQRAAIGGRGDDPTLTGVHHAVVVEVAA